MNGMNVGTAGGTKAVAEIWIGTASGARQAAEGWIGTAAGNRQFLAVESEPPPEPDPLTVEISGGSGFGEASASGGTPPYVSFDWEISEGGGEITSGQGANVITYSGGPIAVTVTVTDIVGATGQNTGVLS